MNIRRTVRLLPLSAVATVLVAVPLASALDDDPTATFTLSSSSGSATMSVNGNATWAFDQTFLDPPSNDNPGTQHTLKFSDFDDVAWSPRQELIAFDVDHARPIISPSPSTDYIPYGWPFVSVPPGDSKTYTFSAAPTSHIIRYWHGACVGSVPWADLFDQISDGFFETLAEQAEAEWYVSETRRNFDAFAPLFNGYLDMLDHGFSFEGEYEIEVAGLLDETFTINPAYSFYVKPESGLVGVKPLRLGVIAIGDIADVVEPALEEELPKVLEREIEQRMSVSLYSPIFGGNCDQTASLEDQQRECFEQMADTSSGDPVLFVVFKQALVSAGYSSAYAGTVAEQMVNALELRNFSCHGKGFGDDGPGECYFHPIVQRVNVLPDRLEFVFAAEVQELWTPEHDLVQLYSYLPDVQTFVDPASDPDQYCYLAYWRRDGVSTYVVHGRAE